MIEADVGPAIKRRSAPLGATMLLVLSFCGYPVDGLTESSVMGLNEVLKANRYVAEGCLIVAWALLLLVWICATIGHLFRRRSVHDQFQRMGRVAAVRRVPSRTVATVNTGGR